MTESFVQHLGDAPRGASPFDIVRALDHAGHRGIVFFDSERAGGHDARWSIISCEPRVVFTQRSARDPIKIQRRHDGGDHEDDLDGSLLDALHGVMREPVPFDELPFVGGLIGVLGFELAGELDDLHATPARARTPLFWIGDYDAALIFDHAEQTWWLVGGDDTHARAQLARVWKDAARGGASSSNLPHRAPRPSIEATDPAEVYRQRVRACIDAITLRGDLFEVNYAERFEVPLPEPALELYAAMRQRSTGAYMGYLDAGAFQVASVSPEQFIEVRARHVVTRPIKGSRRRSDDPVADRELAMELQASPKDRAENVMIVDLMRNDLTRVCELGSVRVDVLCGLESFAGIHHLVSTVSGTLDERVSPIAALLASFPAGSITGAPKLASIEHIIDLEHTPRGLYTGSLFYASRNGQLDSSVLIRTAEVVDGVAMYGAGGAVVADSEPDSEWREALLKVAPLRRAFSDGVGDK